MIPGKENNIIIWDKPVTQIGRSKACDITILEPDISTLHCELIMVKVNLDGEKRKYYNIIDRSRNGTYINGNKLVKKDYLLQDGDKLVFGKSCSFLFKYCSPDCNHFQSCFNTDEKYTHDNVFKKPSIGPQTISKPPKRSKNIRKTFKDKYIAGKELGSGHYSIVKDAVNRITGQTVAVKIFHPQMNNDYKKTKQFCDETKILMSIEHKNIVKLLDRFVEPFSTTQIQSYLVLEKINDGELFDRIVRKTKLRQNETKELFKQILSGLKYLHDRNIIHRDIKPENVLLNIIKRKFPDEQQLGPWDHDEIDIQVKIADFGLAKFTGEMQFTNTLCGTPSYVAPEVLMKADYTSKVDLWSAGVLLYVCLCGFPPFSDQLAPPSMKDQILKGNYSFYSPYWDEIDDSILHLISNLLIVNPTQRYTVEDVMNHSWISGANIANSSKDFKHISRRQEEPPKTYSELSNLQNFP